MDKTRLCVDFSCQHSTVQVRQAYLESQGCTVCVYNKSVVDIANACQVVRHTVNILYLVEGQNVCNAFELWHGHL